MARSQGLNFESNFSATITTAARELNRAAWIFQSGAQPLLAISDRPPVRASSISHTSNLCLKRV
jgi:hypothetical protein